MRVRSLASTGGLCLLVSLGVAACGSSKSGGSKVSGNELTVYSSLPQQASDREQSLDMIAGEKLALKQAGGKAGKFKVKLVSLDDATAAAGKWDPSQVSANARRAAQDSSTIAYIGEFNSGASAISIPILNEACILQVSPANTAIELTRTSAAVPGSPNKYYPNLSGCGRSYARIVPVDTFQAKAQLTEMKKLGVTKLYVLDDKETYGQGIAIEVKKDAASYGIQAVAEEGIDPKATNYRSLAQKIKASGANGMFFGGITNNGAVQLWKDVAAANPNAKLFGPDGVDEDSFSKNIGQQAAKNTYLTVPGLPTNKLAPSGQAVIKELTAQEHKTPQPYAIFGYEAMSSILAALDRAGANADNRKDVIKAYLSTKDRQSVLGTYSIDSGGDTSLATYLVHTVAPNGSRTIKEFLKI